MSRSRRLRKMSKRFKDQNILDEWNSCRISPLRKNTIIYGEVLFTCDYTKIIGNQKNSYNDLISLIGECELKGNPTKSYKDSDYNFELPKKAKVLMSNIEGLKFRSQKGLILPNKFQDRINTLISNSGKKLLSFKCGCINDERKFKKEVADNYIPVLSFKKGVFIKEKDVFTQWYPISWIENYVEINDNIIENKKVWMAESEYNNTISILNKDEHNKFTKTGHKAIGCFPVEEKEVISSVKKFIKNKINKNGPYLSIDEFNELKNKKSKIVHTESLKDKNIVCHIKSFVNSSIKNKKSPKIPISEAMQKFGNYGFSSRFKSFYDPKDVDSEFIKTGFQCKGPKGEKINKVSMTIKNYKSIN